jgi:glycine oxidase
MRRLDAVIVGGGIIGLMSAWQARQRGLNVCVLERDRVGAGASTVAAGVLAPEPEADGMGPLSTAAARLWPGIAAQLGEVGYTQCGSLVLSWHGERDADGPWLEAAEVRNREPGVSPDCVGAVLLEDDALVDPRLVVAALGEQLRGAVRTGASVAGVDAEGATLEDGTRVEADRVVLAAGAWSAQSLAPGLPVKPVKGQVVRFRGPRLTTHIIESDGIYVVPRPTGETIVGATVEEVGFDTAVTDEATAEVLPPAIRAVPAVASLELVEAAASVRPGSADGRPFLGDWNGVLVACGHFRNGILLSSITAEFVAATLAGEEPPPETAGFEPGRAGHGSSG